MKKKGKAMSTKERKLRRSVSSRRTRGSEVTTSPSEDIATTVRYVDAIFGPGTGEKHVAFLERIENGAMRDVVHRCHAIEADTTHVSLEENYLIGMCVLAATGNRGTAAMFAKVLLVLGVPKAKILEAASRLSMWTGALPAAEIAFVIQGAVAEFERLGVASLRGWFPETTEPAERSNGGRSSTRRGVTS